MVGFWVGVVTRECSFLSVIQRSSTDVRLDKGKERCQFMAF